MLRIQMILYDGFHLFKTSRKCKLIYQEEQLPGKEWRKLLAGVDMFLTLVVVFSWVDKYVSLPNVHLKHE